MKTAISFLVSLGVLGYLILVAWVLFMLSMVAYGLYLAFSVSLVLGVIVFLVEPSPLIIGLVMFFFHKNLAQILMDFLSR